MKIKQIFSFMLSIIIMTSCIVTNSFSAIAEEADYGVVKEGAGGSLFLYLGENSITLKGSKGGIKADTINMVSLKRTEDLQTKDGKAQLRLPSVDLKGKNFNKLDIWVGKNNTVDMTLSIKVGDTEIALISGIKDTGAWEPKPFTADLITTEANGDVIVDITGDGGNYCGNYGYIRIYNGDVDDTPVGPNDSDEKLPYQNENLSFEERAADLVSRMTLEEKLYQLDYQASAVDRLGVHSYHYWREALHGVARQKQATSFPTALSMSNTWNPKLIQSMASIISDEARGKNNRYDLSYWSPTVNMARDPRWGRNEESFGEDPYLAGQIGTSFVKGMQGTDDADNGGYLKTIATLKHFAANNNEQNRRGGSSKMTEFNLRNYYTRVFQNISEEVMPASFMSSYNATTIYRNGNILYNYKPSATNSYLLQDVLRRNWGFDGYVTSDCGAGDDIVNNNYYKNGILGDTKLENGAYLAEAFKNGLNLECYLSGYNATKKDGAQMAEKYLSEGDLDRAVYELFLQRFRTGEFDANGGKYRKINSSVIETKEHIDKAEEVAEETWVLLENKNNILPLKAKSKNISNNDTKSNNELYSVKGTSISENGNIKVNLEYNGTTPPDTEAVMISSVKSPTEEKIKETDVKNVKGSGEYEIKASSEDDTEIYIWNNLEEMKPLMPAYSINQSSGNYKVAVVGNLANAALLGDYTGSPENVTYPIDGIRESIEKICPGAEVNLLGTVADTEELFNVKSITLVLKDGKTRSVDLSKAEDVNGMIRNEGTFTNVTPKASAVIKNINFTNVVSVNVEMATGNKIGGTLNISYGVGGPTVATIKSVPTSDLNTYEVCKGEYVGADGGYDGTNDMYISFGAEAEKFSVEAYKDALDAADVIIAYGGTIPKQSTYGVSGDSDSAESNDRKNIDIPAHQSHINEICGSEYADKTILVMSTVGQMNIEAFKDKCAAVLWTSYNGQTQGTALGKVLIGEVNPSGRLTTTWYKNDDVKKMELSNNTEQIVGDIKGKYTDYEIQPHGTDPGHTYQYYTNTPVYPFGYGKSYTTFDYSNANADKTTVDANGEITFTVNVKNSGKQTGKEVVQLYVKHPALTDNSAFDSNLMPKKQLKGFEKVEIPAGGEENVTIKLNVRDMYLFSEKLQKDVVPTGVYTAYIGKDASDESNKVEFTVTGTLDSKIKTVKAIPDGIVLKGRTDEDGTNLVTDNEINPRLSAVMTDEQILFDNNKPVDTSKVTVEYKSNDENIAAVKDGKIVSSAKEGVTTITASVKFNGETKTTIFPVVNQLSIKVSDSELTEALSNIDSVYKELESRKNVYKAETWDKIVKIKTDGDAEIKVAINTMTKDEFNALVEKIIDDMKSIPLDNLDEKNNIYVLSSVNSKHIENGVIDYREGGIPVYSGNKNTITIDSPNGDIQMQVSNKDGSNINGSNIMWQVEKIDTSNRKVADIDKKTGKLTIYGNGVILITAVNTDTAEFGTLKVYVNTQVEGEYADDGGKANLDDAKSNASGGKDVGSSKDTWILYKSVKLSDLSGISARYSNKDKAETTKINFSLAQNTNPENLIAVSSNVEVTGNWNSFTDIALNIQSEALANAKLDENGCADIYVQTNALNLDYFRLSYKNGNVNMDSLPNNSNSEDRVIQYGRWKDADVVLTKNDATGTTTVWTVISDNLKLPFSTDYFAEADVDYNKIDLKMNCFTEYKDRLYVGCDDGLLVVFTECVKCYKLKKLCGIDIKSMSIDGDTIYVSNGTRNLEFSMTDIGGDSIEAEEANVLVANGGIFVDVRSAEEFAEKSVVGSVWLITVKILF